MKNKTSQHGICKRNSPDKNEGRTGCVREIPHIKTKSKTNMGCIRQTPQIKREREREEKKVSTYMSEKLPR